MRHEEIAPTAEKPARLGRADPLLQELRAVKTALNAQAGYSVEKLAEPARQFDLEATLARLRQQHCGGRWVDARESDDHAAVRWAAAEK